MSIFSVGLSGLNSAQRALHTTSNNIGNVYTPGYNREIALFSENLVGGGAQVIDSQRQFDYFVASQLNRASSAFASLDSYHNQISQIDNLLADTEAGLGAIVQNFFSSLQDLSATPSDPAARQGVLGAAESLTAQLSSFDTYLDDMQVGVGEQVKSEIIQINNTAQQIATLNEEISIARAKMGEAPNGLLNQRDRLVGELSERVDTQLHIQDGRYNITMNGRPLVAGTQAYSLEAVASAADPSRIGVAYVDSAGNPLEIEEDAFSGGSLGGLLSFRRETLDQVQNALGQLTVSLAMGFNAQHEAGIDQNGDPGQAFFSVGSPRVYSNDNNTGSAVLSAGFDDHLSLTGQDYQLRVSDAGAGEFTITPIGSDDSFTLTLDGANQLNFDGMQLTIDDPGLLNNGDRYQVQPTRYATGEIELMLTDVGEIAAGQSSASGDNRNALALLSLQEEKLVGNDSSLNQALAALVGDVGNRSNIVQVNMDAQEKLKEQIYMVQQSESGVNLDEEAANLIRFQQYYQANAKVIEIGTTMLDILLNMRN